jgi:hypothetical protein
MLNKELNVKDWRLEEGWQWRKAIHFSKTQT